MGPCNASPALLVGLIAVVVAEAEFTGAALGGRVTRLLAPISRSKPS
jgi:hypothetical protein